MSPTEPPKQTQILVIGGGPAGSYTAAALAREGFNVVLLEMAKFPRYHIGESLIPSARHYLRFIDAEDKVASYGFTRKPGSAIKFNQYMQEGYTDFVALGAQNNAWNVVRSEFDHLLLKHAAENGVQVFEETKVLSIKFETGNDNGGSSASSCEATTEPTSTSSSGSWITSSFPWNVTSSLSPSACFRRARSATFSIPSLSSTTSSRRSTISISSAPSNSVSSSTRSTSLANSSSRTRHSLTESGRGIDDACGGELGKPVSLTYITASGEKGEIKFDYLVDASGRAGIMSTKYLKNRRYNDSLKNVAVWGYWRGTGMYGKGTDRENAPFFEALSDESGWAWFIPLHDGLTSVGIVMDQKQLGIRSRACSSAGTPFPPSTPTTPMGPLDTNGRPRSGSTVFPPNTGSSVGEEPSSRRTSALAERYLTFLHFAPGVLGLIGDGELVRVDHGSEGDGGEGHGRREEDIPMARSASDFSYSAGKYGGKGWRVVGDAGAFIDPFFSSGVHLALTGGLSAAASISASLRGDCSESEASEWFSGRVAISYTRFLVVVLSAYKQIRAQSLNVLADVGDENFNRAFDFLRPVIQGGAEMGARLSEDEVQHALDFCVNLFSPTTPEQHETVRHKLRSLRHHPLSSDFLVEEEDDNERLLDVRSPIIDPKELKSFLRRESRMRAKIPPPILTSNLSPTSEASSPSTSASSSPDSITTTFSTSSLGTNPDQEQKAQDFEEDSEMKMVLEKVNARRVIHAEHSADGLLNHSLEEEDVSGFVVRLERGKLGLIRVRRPEGKVKSDDVEV